MPCYTVQLISVEFKAANKELLLSALKKLNWKYKIDKNIITTNGINIDLKAQTAVSYDSNLINKLKREYSIEAIKKATTTKQWTMRKNKQENSFQVVRY